MSCQALCTLYPPLSETKQTISPSENVSHADHLPLCAVFVSEQLWTMFVPNSPDIVWSAYVKTAIVFVQKLGEQKKLYPGSLNINSRADKRCSSTWRVKTNKCDIRRTTCWVQPTSMEIPFVPLDIGYFKYFSPYKNKYLSEICNQWLTFYL